VGDAERRGEAEGGGERDTPAVALTDSVLAREGLPVGVPAATVTVGGAEGEGSAGEALWVPLAQPLGDTLALPTPLPAAVLVGVGAEGEGVPEAEAREAEARAEREGTEAVAMGVRVTGEDGDAPARVGDPVPDALPLPAPPEELEGAEEEVGWEAEGEEVPPPPRDGEGVSVAPLAEAQADGGAEMDAVGEALPPEGVAVAGRCVGVGGSERDAEAQCVWEGSGVAVGDIVPHRLAGGEREVEGVTLQDSVGRGDGEREVVAVAQREGAPLWE
jgi:hypothetical protein